MDGAYAEQRALVVFEQRLFSTFLSVKRVETEEKSKTIEEKQLKQIVPTMS